MPVIVWQLFFTQTPLPDKQILVFVLTEELTKTNSVPEKTRVML